MHISLFEIFETMKVVFKEDVLLVGWRDSTVGGASNIALNTTHLDLNPSTPYELWKE